MQKWFAIALATIITVQASHITLGDVLQFDELIGHARFHKEQYGDSFASFLIKHYGDQQAAHMNDRSNEREDHQKLPFQHGFNHLNCPVALLVDIEFEFRVTEYKTNSKDNYFHKLHGDLLVFQALQPPRNT